MKKLNLPVIKKKIPAGKALSMDEYLNFVNFHLKHTFNRKAYEKWEKLQTVNIPFSLK